MFTSGAVLAPHSHKVESLPSFQALDGYYQVVALNILLELARVPSIHPLTVTGGNAYAPALAVLVGAGLVRRLAGGMVELASVEPCLHVAQWYWTRRSLHLARYWALQSGCTGSHWRRMLWQELPF